jgi:hypothetical protein
MGNKRKIHLLTWVMLIAFGWPHGFQDVHRLLHHACACDHACETQQSQHEDCFLCSFGFYLFELPEPQAKPPGSFLALPKLHNSKLMLVAIIEQPAYRLRGPPLFSNNNKPHTTKTN